MRLQYACAHHLVLQYACASHHLVCARQHGGLHMIHAHLLQGGHVAHTPMHLRRHITTAIMCPCRCMLLQHAACMERKRLAQLLCMMNSLSWAPQCSACMHADTWGHGEHARMHACRTQHSTCVQPVKKVRVSLLEVQWRRPSR